MISRLLFSLILISIVLSEPDFCRNPKLDSITYIPDKKMYFFTSDGYYWFFNDTEFPGQPIGPLPDGFKRGDAAYYMDYKSLCKTVKTPPKKEVRKDQVVVVVEKVGDGNQLIEFDTNTMIWSKSQEWNANKLVGRAKIPNPREEIKSIFTKGRRIDSIHNEIYVVQDPNVAAVNWFEYCSNPDIYAEAYNCVEYRDFVSHGKVYDAIITKGENLYLFYNYSYQPFEIEFDLSINGKIRGSRRVEETIKEFFKLPDKCPEIGVTTSPNQTNEPENGVTSGTGVDYENTDKPQESGSEGSGGGGLFLIIIIVVVLVIVAFLIGLVVWGMKGKSEPETNKGGAQPATKASAATQTGAPKAPPKAVQS